MRVSIGYEPRGGKYRVGFVEVLRENLVMGAPGSILRFNTCCRLHVTLASSASLTVAFIVKSPCCVISVNIKNIDNRYIIHSDRKFVSKYFRGYQTPTKIFLQKNLTREYFHTRKFPDLR